jgi:hypothetical protein
VFGVQPEGRSVCRNALRVRAEAIEGAVIQQLSVTRFDT